jgi:molybdopterin converting factor subunit 1
MMKISLKYFAAIREHIGHDQETLEFADDTRISDVRVALVAHYPSIAGILSRSVVARNRTFASEETPLANGDEIVFIPPMAGG